MFENEGSETETGRWGAGTVCLRMKVWRKRQVGGEPGTVCGCQLYELNSLVVALNENIC